MSTAPNTAPNTEADGAPPLVAVTLGDPAGIGPEVVARALQMPEVRQILLQRC